MHFSGLFPYSSYSKPDHIFQGGQPQVMLPVSFLIFLAVWLVLLPVAYQTTGGDMGLLTWPALFCHNLNFLFMWLGWDEAEMVCF